MTHKPTGRKVIYKQAAGRQAGQQAGRQVPAYKQTIWRPDGRGKPGRSAGKAFHRTGLDMFDMPQPGRAAPLHSAALLTEWRHALLHNHLQCHAPGITLWSWSSLFAGEHSTGSTSCRHTCSWMWLGPIIWHACMSRLVTTASCKSEPKRNKMNLGVAWPCTIVTSVRAMATFDSLLVRTLTSKMQKGLAKVVWSQKAFWQGHNAQTCTMGMGGTGYSRAMVQTQGSSHLNDINPGKMCCLHRLQLAVRSLLHKDWSMECRRLYCISSDRLCTCQIWL